MNDMILLDKVFTPSSFYVSFEVFAGDGDYYNVIRREFKIEDDCNKTLAYIKELYTDLRKAFGDQPCDKPEWFNQKYPGFEWSTDPFTDACYALQAIRIWYIDVNGVAWTVQLNDAGGWSFN